MRLPLIRLARADEYDDIARLWMHSWVSTGRFMMKYYRWTKEGTQS